MKPLRTVTILLLGSQLIAASPPSSDIPPRREFPVNDSIRPCDDFYEYACSNVLSSFKLRDDRSYHNFAFSDSAERILEAKKKFLSELSEGAIGGNKISDRSRQLQNVYKSCMNEKERSIEEKAEVRRLQAEVARIKTNQDFVRFVETKVGSKDFGVFDFGPISNLDNPENYDVYVVADLKTLPERSYYSKPDVALAFEKVVTEFFRTIDPRNAKRAQNRARAVVRFEKDFAATYPLPAEIRDILSKKTELSRQQIRGFSSLGLNPLLGRIPEKTLIRDLAHENLIWLNTAFAKTQVAVLRDEYLWRSLSEFMDDAYPKFFEKFFAFQHAYLGGPEKRSDRPERCTKFVMKAFGPEMDAELVDKMFPEFPTERFVSLVEKVRATLVDGIEHNGWLSEGARKAGAEKMRLARLQLVKPQRDEDWDFQLPAEYSDKKFIANMRLLRLKSIEKALGKLSKTRNPNEWHMSPLTVNAYYSAADNKFVMPIGILQYPFYDPKESDAANFGAIGAVAGHELGHGIDDKGSRYDASGRLKGWMTEDDLASFKKRGQKLVAQFNAIGHNGDLTLGENIGDLVGLTFAYRAAFPEDEGSSEAKKAFFLQYARSWCTTMRPKLREARLKTDPHSMGEARVNEQVKHQDGFAEAYSCKAGDKLFLDPEDRIRIW